MSDTIASINNKLQDKFTKLSKFLDHVPEEFRNDDYDNITASLYQVMSDYTICTMDFISISSDGTMLMIGDTDQFILTLNNSKINDKITECLNTCKPFIQRCAGVLPNKIIEDMTFLLGYTLQNIVNLTPKSPKYDMCCNRLMNYDSRQSIIHCPVCNKTMAIIGDIDIKTRINSNKKPQANSYNRHRNFQSGFDLVLCRDDYIPEDHEDKQFRRWFNNNGFKSAEELTGLTITDIRDMIKDLKWPTKLNKHAPKLLYLYSGIQPVECTPTEYTEVLNMYSRVIPILHDKLDEVTEEIKNTPFGPYLVYRIFKHLWGNRPDKMRIVLFIYFKESQTLTKYDNLWRHVCNTLVPKIKYVSISPDDYIT
jgi:hypothetical protein